ncbi:unnamed protein product [Strongylus vulgaris]|uniref:Uncharacterized protein n=1 Tax=Strongylus vulgaris TaxID=40348 RepID=A0A3P7JXM1_STRVU|nr:unnamed protein product [Strongylus vulgaris]
MKLTVVYMKKYKQEGTEVDKFAERKVENMKAYIRLSMVVDEAGSVVWMTISLRVQRLERTNFATILFLF